MASRYLVACVVLAIACGGDDAPGTGSTTTDPTTTVGTSLTTSATSSATQTTSDESSSSGDASSESSGVVDSSTGEPACPDTHECVALPEGWHGPSLLRLDTADAPADPCPSEYPNTDDLGGADLLADPATCGCTCGDASGTACAPSTTLRYYGTDATCSSAPLSAEIFTTACNLLPAIFPTNAHWVLDPVLVEGGACEPLATVDVVPPAFATTATVCSGAELLDVGCDADNSEVCAPRIGDEQLCIWQDGEQRCPAGFERRAMTFHRTVDDARTCTECSCGDPVGLCDDAFAYLFTNVCNPPISGLVTADGECHGTSGVYSTQSAALSVGEPTAFCSAGVVGPIGEATPAMPVTVCCG